RGKANRQELAGIRVVLRDGLDAESLNGIFVQFDSQAGALGYERGSVFHLNRGLDHLVRVDAMAIHLRPACMSQHTGEVEREGRGDPGAYQLQKERLAGFSGHSGIGFDAIGSSTDDETIADIFAQRRHDRRHAIVHRDRDARLTAQLLVPGDIRLRNGGFIYRHLWVLFDLDEIAAGVRRIHESVVEIEINTQVWRETRHEFFALILEVEPWPRLGFEGGKAGGHGVLTFEHPVASGHVDGPPADKATIAHLD